MTLVFPSASCLVGNFFHLKVYQYNYPHQLQTSEQIIRTIKVRWWYILYTNKQEGVIIPIYVCCNHGHGCWSKFLTSHFST